MNQSNDAAGSFDAAHVLWRTWSSGALETDLEEQFLAAERTLLDHRARTLEEAAVQLSVVIEAMVGGGRSDGKDIDVVRRAQALMLETGSARRRA